MWDGFLLRCPSCRQGSIYSSFFKMNTRCHHCDAQFEREGEGDFLGAAVTAYALTACLVMVLVFLLNVLTEMTVTAQLLTVGIASLVFILTFYRNMRGIWVGILLVLLNVMR